MKRTFYPLFLPLLMSLFAAAQKQTTQGFATTNLFVKDTTPCYDPYDRGTEKHGLYPMTNETLLAGSPCFNPLNSNEVVYVKTVLGGSNVGA
ncbi:MAG: hypothetical protein JWO06_2543 [Bacteroidota bacterium]|nr:hypothetical protein [Bacteroidota bacterium]